MNYQLNKFNKFDLAVILILLITIFNEIYYRINFTKILDDAALFGVIVIIFIWVVDYWREDDFNKRIIHRLLYELRTALPTINKNIYLIREKEKGNAKDLHGFAYINNEILISLISTLKIAIIPQQETINYLIHYGNVVKTINRLIDLQQVERSPLFVWQQLRRANQSLGVIFQAFNRSNFYQEHCLIISEEPLSMLNTEDILLNE